MISVRLDIILLLMLIVVLLLVSFSLYLFWERAKQLRHQERVQYYIEANKQQWFQMLHDIEPLSEQWIPSKQHEYDAIEEIFVSYIQTLSNPSICNKIYQFANDYLADYYRGRLTSRHWSVRMNSLYRVCDFQLQSLLEPCKQMRQRRITREEHYQLLKVILMFEEELFLEDLIRSPYEFAAYEYKQLMSLLSQDTLQEAMLRSDELLPECQYALVDVIGANREPRDYSYLKGLLQSEDQELRIRALKAIYQLGVAIAITPYQSFLSSEVWEERLMVAQLLQRLPYEQAAELYKKLAEDDSWHVREQAKRAIIEHENSIQDNQPKKGSNRHEHRNPSSYAVLR